MSSTHPRAPRTEIHFLPYPFSFIEGGSYIMGIFAFDLESLERGRSECDINDPTPVRESPERGSHPEPNPEPNLVKSYAIQKRTKE